MGKLQDYLRDQAAEYPYVRGLYDAIAALDECEKALREIAAPIEGTPVGDPWAFYADLQVVARTTLAKLEGGK